MSLKPGKSLPAQALYRRCDPMQLTFETTESLEDFSKIPGQDRAVEAIHFATEIDVDGHNIPMRDDEVIKSEDFEKLSEKQQKKFIKISMI